MKENELISIVVPVYKVEKYLDDCIVSIINQTYRNIEIILVDDGSPDNCGEICDRYAKSDNRIQVIHKENGGLSDARNAGIDVASGKFIAFVDSDDYIEKEYIEYLYNAIKQNNVDIAQCGINKVDEEKNLIEKIKQQEKVITPEEDMQDLYDRSKWENIVTWNKLYLKSLFDDCRFPKGKIHEDEFTTYKLLFKTNKIAIIDNTLYNYRINPNSIMQRNYNVKRLHAIQAMQERLKFFEDSNNKELYNKTLITLLYVIRDRYVNVRAYMEDSKQLQKDLIKLYKETYKKEVNSKKFRITERMKLKLFYMMPDVYYILIRVLKRNLY